VSWCQKKSSGLYGAREDIKGRHTDNPAGRHSIRTNQQPTSFIPLFMLDALCAATLPIYPGLGQAPNMLACTPSGLVNYSNFYVFVIAFSAMTLFMAALCNRGAIIFLACDFYLSIFLSFFFFSSPNLSGRRSDVCHTSTHGVALVRI